MTSRRELKRYAKEAMSGKYGTVILAFVLVQALSLAGGMLSSALFPGTGILETVLGYIFSFILTLLINVISAGVNYMYLNIARGKAYSLNDLIYFYKNHPDRVIVATFILAVLNFLTMLPYTIYGSNAEVGDSLESQITWVYTCFMLAIIGMIVFQILVIPLEMTYCILADRPAVSGTDALKESIELMRGNFGKYLLLKLSFVPLMILSVFTFYIALLWILPYLQMTEIMFYRDLTGELAQQKEEEERAAQDYVNPMFGGQPQEKKQDHQFWSEPEKPADIQNTTQSAEAEYDQNSEEVQKDQADPANEAQQGNSSAKEEEEDNEPKPWDEYFNQIR